MSKPDSFLFQTIPDQINLAFWRLDGMRRFLLERMDHPDFVGELHCVDDAERIAAYPDARGAAGMSAAADMPASARILTTVGAHGSTGDWQVASPCKVRGPEALLADTSAATGVFLNRNLESPDPKILIVELWKPDPKIPA